MHFYPHNIPDFNNSTRHLTRVERSVYRDAIERYYDTESVLTKDFDVLAKRLLCNSDEEKAALKSILKEFFIETDDGYFHDRCNTEIIKYRANASAKAKAGKASALSRQQKSVSRKHKLTGVEQPLNSVEQNKNYELITNNHDVVGKVIELTIQKPPPPQEFIYSNLAFPMHGEWEPSPNFPILAKIAGMILDQDKPPVDEFLEFRSYWVTRPDRQRTQGEWEHAFIQDWKKKKARAM